MLKIIKSGHIKSIVLIGLIVGSIFCVKIILVNINHSDAIQEMHYLKK